MSSNKRLPVTVVPMDEGNRALYNSFPSRFEVTGKVWANNEEGFFLFEVEPYERPYPVKTYPDAPWREREDQAVFFALDGEACVGQVHVAMHWNGLARVEDIRVRQDCRRGGVGRALMDAAVAWAKDRGVPAVCLETQDNNVAACRFYAEYGFFLAGIDQAVYLATPHKGETALYWYHFLAPMEWG